MISPVANSQLPNAATSRVSLEGTTEFANVIEAAASIWQEHIDTIITISDGLKGQWTSMVEGDNAAAFVEAAVLRLFKLLEDALESLVVQLAEVGKSSSQPSAAASLVQHITILRGIVRDALDTQLVPAIFTFVIGPIPSTSTQIAAAELIIKMVNVFRGGARDPLPLNVSQTSLLTDDDWDSIAESHSLGDALEVALVNSGSWCGDNNDAALPLEVADLNVLHTLLELALVLTTSSAVISASLLCGNADDNTSNNDRQNSAASQKAEVEGGIGQIVRKIGFRCCLPLPEQLTSESTVDLVEAELKRMSLLCYVICLFEGMASKVSDDGGTSPQRNRECASPAAFLLAEGGVYELISHVLAIPCGAVVPNKSPAAAATAGVATAHGLALQLLEYLSRRCFSHLWLLMCGGDGIAPLNIVSNIINIISASPFAEVAKAATLWLELCVRVVGGSTISARVDTTALWPPQRSAVIAFFRSLLSQHPIMHILQEIIQNHLTATTSDDNNLHEAAAQCSVAALMCVYGLCLYSPWEVQVPHYVAREHKVLLGMLITSLRRNRVGAGSVGQLVSSHVERGPSFNRFISNVYCMLCLGVVCAFGRHGRGIVAALLQTSTVMGAGRGASAGTLMAQTLVNLWFDLELYLSSCSSLASSTNSTFFSEWHFHDEHGTQLIQSDFLSNVPDTQSLIVAASQVKFRDTLSEHYASNSLKEFPDITMPRGSRSSSAASTPTKGTVLPTVACRDVSSLFLLQELPTDERFVIIQHALRLHEQNGRGSFLPPSVTAPALLFGALHQTFTAASHGLSRQHVLTQHPATLPAKDVSGNVISRGGVRASGEVGEAAGQPLTRQLLLENGVRDSVTAAAVMATSSTVSFKATMSLLASLSHHYVGNVSKLRQLEVALARREVNAPLGGASKLKNTMLINIEDEKSARKQIFSESLNVPRRDLSNPKKVFFSAAAQSTRCWSVRDVQPDDVCEISVALARPTEALLEVPSARAPPLSSDTVLKGSTLPDDCSVQQILHALSSAQRKVRQHLVAIHASLEMCPMTNPTRRCLLNDLYGNVYPKVLVFIQGIMWLLSGGIVVRGDAVSAPAACYNHAAAQALLRFVRGEKSDNFIHAGNLLEVYHYLMERFAIQ